MEIWRFVAGVAALTGGLAAVVDATGVMGASITNISSTWPSRASPGGATYTFTPVRKMYWSELPLTAARWGTSSTKKMSQHSLVSGAAFWAPRRIIREECASTRIESGDALSIAPHDEPLVPEGRNRLSPFSTRSQSWRVIVAWTAASDVFESEKLADTRLLPAVVMVTSSGSTSSCADTGCETTTPTAQRASTVARARPPRSAPAVSGEREQEIFTVTEPSG